MIVNMSSILNDARKHGYAIGSFNVYNYETIRAVIESAEEMQIPVIVAFGERYMENMDFDTVSSIVNSISKNLSIPVALHLDHCKSFDNIVKAIRFGFTSVMFDGSGLDYKDNIEKTKLVVSVAHAAGVTVEAELGSIASGNFSSEEGGDEIYTDPEQAREFVDLTGTDALAVSIGTVHGLYKGEPRINIDVLKAIAGKVQIPLVLHGGSGTPEKVIRDCIKNGICKINVNTEISMFAVSKLKELIQSNTNIHLSKVSLMQVKFIKEIVKKYISLFYIR